MKRGLLSWLLHKKERLSDYQLYFGKETLPTFRLDSLGIQGESEVAMNTCHFIAMHVANYVTRCMSREARG